MKILSFIIIFLTCSHDLLAQQCKLNSYQYQTCYTTPIVVTPGTPGTPATPTRTVVNTVTGEVTITEGRPARAGTPDIVTGGETICNTHHNIELSIDDEPTSRSSDWRTVIDLAEDYINSNDCDPIPSKCEISNNWLLIDNEKAISFNLSSQRATRDHLKKLIAYLQIRDLCE